ncbi:DUF5829 family protein [Biformimicrobium ophioploci]|uniref:Uncharacterized protein n=1 Tax=Biformimicrobium ophioploci TaxID=3036711 RepID=A0ABQ6LY16_9GAMM|nr:DUF5829 family protein [Microbulbifer sp. NKW57]GMG86961.1 hypothetical protein MNKW57_12820 [Microbulbifer sp. NKW57]
MNKWILYAVSAVFAASASNTLAHPKQIAFLNHLYAVVDIETVNAIEQSSYLPGFIDYEKLTVTADGEESWTGRYLSGRSTYIEFFSPGDVAGGELGNIGLAFGTERVGDIVRMARHMRKDDARFSREMRKRSFDGEEVDWFHDLGLKMENTGAEFWAMEYVADYMDHTAANKELAEGDWDRISRERYLNDNYRGKLVRDIAYVAFHIDKASIQEAMPLILAAGYEVVEGDGLTRLLGQEAEIDLFHAEGGKRGLGKLGFALNRAVTGQHLERIGNSELRVGPGEIATWTFELQES